MNREKFKNELYEELVFFRSIAQRDLKKGFTINQVGDAFGNFAYSFYGSRLDFDAFASKKAYFVAKNIFSIINGNLDEKLVDKLCDEIEEEHKIRVK